MNDSLVRISLDIHSPQSQVSIPVTQFDTARGILVTLTEGGKPYMLSDECRAVFTGTKADGNQLYNDCIILNNSVIRYDFTEQTTAAIGIVDASIKVFGADNKVLTSPRLTLLVYESTVGSITPSNTELNIIVELAKNDLVQDANIASMYNTLIKVQKDISVAKNDIVLANNAITQAQSDIDQNKSDIDQNKSDIDQAKNDIEDMVSVSLATFPKNGWLAGYQAKSVDPLTTGDVILLLPANEDTRKAASKASIYAKPEGLWGKLSNEYYVYKPDNLTPTDVDLTFVELRFNDSSDTDPRVALIGLNTTADDIDASIQQATEEIEQAKSDIVQARLDFMQAKSEINQAKSEIDQTKSDIDQAKSDIDDIVTIETRQLGILSWEENGAPISVALVDNSDVIFVIPADEASKNIASKARLYIEPEPYKTTANYITFYVKHKGARPGLGETVNLALIKLKDKGGVMPKVALIGVDTYGDDIPTSIDLSRMDEGEIVETFAGGTTKTTTIEYDADGNPVKITDVDGNVTVLTW